MSLRSRPGQIRRLVRQLAVAGGLRRERGAAARRCRKLVLCGLRCEKCVCAFAGWGI